MFYENLIKLCEERGVKLTPTTEKLGISPGTIKGWKSGGSPTGDTLLKFSKHFNISTDYLLTGKDTYRNIINGNHGQIGVVGTANAPIVLEGEGKKQLSSEAIELLNIYETSDFENKIKLLTYAAEIKKQQV